MADGERALGRGVDLDAARLIDARDDDVRLHRHVLHLRHGEGVLDDVAALLERARVVAFAHLEVVADVGARGGRDPRLDRVLAHVRVDERRALLDAVEHAEHCGQGLVIDLDERGGFGGGLGRLGGDGGHRVAHEAHAVDGEDGLVLQVDAGVQREIAAGDHGAHARDGAGLRHIDAVDEGVGVRRADDVRVEHARELEVARVERGAGDLLDAIDAQRRVTDDMVLSHGVLPSLPARIAAAPSWMASMIWR